MVNNRGHEHRDILQRYCPHIDDNVVVIKSLNKNPDEYECMSSHLCKEKSVTGCKRLPDESISVQNQIK